MKHFQQLPLLFLLFVFSFNISRAAVKLQYEENKGQCDSNVQYKADLTGGRVFAGKDRLTYVFYSREDLELAHERSIDGSTSLVSPENTVIHCHAMRMNFVNADREVFLSPSQQAEGLTNYFLGNDPSKWASNVKAYYQVYYSNLYHGIDMKLYSNELNTEYDFIVSPGSNANQISMAYEGANNISLNGGNLLISTSVNTVTEMMPYAYQVINGNQVPVSCSYVLNGSNVSFSIGAYDVNLPLIIDPTLVASTYMGSTIDSWGQCASFDAVGNVISAGRCFGIGYPVTVGAFQTTFGGAQDMSISKLTPTGSARVWVTYLGGNNTDYAQNMFSTSNGDLYVYGSTMSTNFPVTAGCYDNTFNGGWDIVVTHLNSTGSALVGSTYIGGTLNDGNGNIGTSSQDAYRGQIIADQTGNAFVASFSSSTNFPFTVGAYSTVNHGGQDAVVFKLNPTCSSLLWSTSLGGSANDGAFSIALASTGDVIVAGTTASNNFPTTPGAYKTTYQGGTYDAFVSHLSANGSTLTASTYYGTTGQDAGMCVDLDANNNVFIAGNNSVALPITGGAYGNANSGNFIAKLNPALTTLMLQTVIGDGTVNSHLVINGFLVDNCGGIYLAGFGATSYPVTSNALYLNSSIGSYHVTVLAPNASSLVYGTYYAGSHTHGGASGFDKRGIVYQTECEYGGFPTLPGSYATTNPSGVYQNAVFKIDNQGGSNVQSQSSLSATSNVSSTTGCAPLTVNFYNNSNGITYIWNFGDGSPTDTATNTSHTYTTTGSFTAMLIAFNPSSCNGSDTSYLTINVTALNVAVSPNTSVCPGGSVTLNATGAATYLWSPSTGLSSTTDSIVICTPSATTTYTVTGTLNGCTGSATVTVTVNPLPNATITPAGPITVCGGNPVTLTTNTGTGYTYQWYNNGTPITGATNFQYSVIATGDYIVQITDGNGCSNTSAAVLVTQGQGPVVTLSSSGGSCNSGVLLSGYPGLPIIITATAPGAVSYLWSPNGQTTQSISITTAGTYSVIAYDANGCPSSAPGDSITITSANVNCGHNGDKIILCHVPPGNPGNPQTICVAASAIPSHLANHPGDCIGPCSLYYAPRYNEILGMIDELGFFAEAYPNPSHDAFNLHLIAAPDEAITLNVYDMTGRIIESYNNVTEQTKIGVSLAPGMYSADVIQGNNHQMLHIVKIN
jgi:PKD repeat protein